MARGGGDVMISVSEARIRNLKIEACRIYVVVVHVYLVGMRWLHSIE